MPSHILSAAAHLHQFALAASTAHHPAPVSMFQAVVLGLLQGVTELFPISSLGHTVLFPTRRIETSDERLAWLIIVASIPTGILGILLEHPVRVGLAKPLAAAIFLIVNGAMLLTAERLRRRAEVRRVAAAHGLDAKGGRKLETLEYKEAFSVGVAQSTALIAGMSRDGVCMTAGLVRGLDHEDSARYAFLLATPIILAAGIFKLPDLTGPLGNGIRLQAVVAAGCAALAGFVSVAFLVRWFKTRTLWPFGVYCVLFGLAMIIYLQT